MKFYKYVIHTLTPELKDITPELKEAWDHYGRMAGTGNTVQKPSAKGPSPKVVVSNIRLTERELAHRGILCKGPYRWSSR